MLRLLRRLHHLKIQLSLEIQSEQTVISYPNVQAPKSRADQHSKISKLHNSHDICGNDIITEVLRAKQDALDSLKDLGMTLKLDVKSKDEVDELLEEDVEEIHNDLYGNDSTEVNLEEDMYTINECAEVLREIDELKDAKVIEEQLHNKIHKSIFFSQIKSDTIPMCVQNDTTKDNTINKNSLKHSTLVEVLYNGKKMYIHKSTAVWIFQEGERLSSNRLIRVRETQPSSTSKTATSSTITTSEKNAIISVGDICVFMNRESSDCM